MTPRKSIVITGAAHGIGRETAILFYENGYQVFAIDFDKAGLDTLKKDVADLKSQSEAPAERLHVFHASTSDKNVLNEIAMNVKELSPNLDALFVNAGVHGSNTILTISDEELDRILHTNIFGSIYTIQAFLPYMVEQKRGAVVINSSDQFFIGKPNNFAYGLTKGALGQIVRSLAADYAKDGIRVNAVCPGTIRTPLSEEAIARYSQRSGKSLDECWAEENSLFPLGRVGEAKEVAKMVRFIVEDATYSTGSFFTCDGGLTAT